MLQSALKPKKRLRKRRTTPRAKLIENLKTVTHLIVKVKANFICVKCNKQYKLGDLGITASHFWNSTKWKTKFVFDNIDCMCWGCHNQIEHNKQGWYMQYKLRQLGQKRYNELEQMAYKIADWQDYELQDMLKLYIMKLLRFNRPDIKYENGTLSTFRKGEWKKVFHNESSQDEERV